MIHDKHLSGLKALAQENLCKRYILVSHDKVTRKTQEYEAMYWWDFLTQLWAGQII